jgi:hypothetical protein
MIDHAEPTFLFVATVIRDGMVEIEVRQNITRRSVFRVPVISMSEGIEKLRGLVRPGFEWKLDALSQLTEPGQRVEGQLECSIDELRAAGFSPEQP